MLSSDGDRFPPEMRGAGASVALVFFLGFIRSQKMNKSNSIGRQLFHCSSLLTLRVNTVSSLLFSAFFFLKDQSEGRQHCLWRRGEVIRQRLFCLKHCIFYVTRVGVEAMTEARVPRLLGVCARDQDLARLYRLVLLCMRA